jgi:hypothetical protein
VSGSEPARPSHPPPRPVAWRWPIVLGVLLALVGAGVGAQQRQVAASWSERAAVLEEERDDARARGEAFQRQLDEVADALAVSESDVGALEDRVRELADEKAQAEDVATTTTVERDSLVELNGAIAGAVTSLDGCVDGLFDLLGDAIDAFNRQGAGEPVDVDPLNAARTTTTSRVQRRPPGGGDRRGDRGSAAAVTSPSRRRRSGSRAPRGRGAPRGCVAAPPPITAGEGPRTSTSSPSSTCPRSPPPPCSAGRRPSRCASARSGATGSGSAPGSCSPATSW